MNIRDKKETIIVIAIFIGVISLFLLFTSQHAVVETKHPQHELILKQDDFNISSPEGIIKVGLSNWEFISRIFPNGKTLGMSTIYEPENSGYIFTFTKKSNILSVVHISTVEASTFRNISVGDSYKKVVDAYGKNYTQVSLKDQKNNFDMVYGNKNVLIFQIRDNMVKQIILQKVDVK